VASAAQTNEARATPARERLLRIADELFYARGLHAVGIDEIIEKSGAAKATLYTHFPTKDDLIASYLRQRSVQWRKHMTTRLADAPASPIERIDAVFVILADGCRTPGFRGCPFINAAVEYPDPRHPASLAGSEHRQWVLELFRSLVVEAKIRQPDRVAAQLALLYDSAMVGTQMNRNPTAASHARDAARILVESALRQTTGRGRTRPSSRPRKRSAASGR
jgi:AcrR family transcriptional regulator